MRKRTTNAQETRFPSGRALVWGVLAASWLPLTSCRPAAGGGGVADPGAVDATVAEAAGEGTTDAATAPAAERTWVVYAGETKILDISDVPGTILDTTAPPPPPSASWQPPRHPFLAATCGGDALACSRAGTLLRESLSLDEFLAKLRAEGWCVEQVGEQGDVGTCAP
jgi:hypothetical protein